MLPLALAWSLFSHARYGYTVSSVGEKDSPLVDLGDRNVSIVISSFKEKKEIEQACIDSILNQNIVLAHPEKFEIIITRLKGKLTARDSAIRRARGSLILNCDSDSIYPPNWANMMLRPFLEIGIGNGIGNEGSGVVATSGPSFYLNYFTDVLASIPIDSSASFRIYGRNSCIRKDAYLSIGGFDLSIDQSDLVQTIDAEEIIFHRRMRQVGRVLAVGAPCIHQVGLELGRNWGKDRWYRVIGREYWRDILQVDVPRIQVGTGVEATTSP